MNRIVIATDGSSGSGHALEEGFELASALGADVSVVYVRHAPHAFLGSPYYQDVLTEEGKHARGVITDAKLSATRYDVDPECEVLEGEPVDAILGFADSRDADLIVVGSRGLVVSPGRCRQRVQGDHQRAEAGRSRRAAHVAAR
jgi:nucleotide-binding universal stress UspA family protein